mgnify:CR=1 FL=1
MIVLHFPDAPVAFLGMLTQPRGVVEIIRQHLRQAARDNCVGVRGFLRRPLLHAREQWCNYTAMPVGMLP